MSWSISSWKRLGEGVCTTKIITVEMYIGIYDINGKSYKISFYG